MYPIHWGCWKDESEPENVMILYPSKKAKQLKKVHINWKEESKLKITTKNHIVTQTIEAMDQSDTINELIEKCTSKTGYNYVFNPCQMMPKLSIPTVGDTNLDNESKFSKPVWFIQPDKTRFTTGIPKDYPLLNKSDVTLALRKSLCGLLRIKGFQESTEQSLILFVDALDEYYNNFMEYIRREILFEVSSVDNTIEILTLEKSYQALTKQSLLQLHNYFKNEILKKNKTEILDLKNNFQEYDKVMQMSKKVPNIKEEDLSTYLEYSDSNTFMNNQDNLSVSNIFEGTNNSGLGDIFDRAVAETSEDHSSTEN